MGSKEQNNTKKHEKITCPYTSSTEAFHTFKKCSGNQQDTLHPNLSHLHLSVWRCFHADPSGLLTERTSHTRNCKNKRSELKIEQTHGVWVMFDLHSSSWGTSGTEIDPASTCGVVTHRQRTGAILQSRSKVVCLRPRPSLKIFSAFLGFCWHDHLQASVRYSSSCSQALVESGRCLKRASFTLEGSWKIPIHLGSHNRGFYMDHCHV